MRGISTDRSQAAALNALAHSQTPQKSEKKEAEKPTATAQSAGGPLDGLPPRKARSPMQETKARFDARSEVRWDGANVLATAKKHSIEAQSDVNALERQTVLPGGPAYVDVQFDRNVQRVAEKYGISSSEGIARLNFAAAWAAARAPGFDLAEVSRKHSISDPHELAQLTAEAVSRGSR